MRLKTLLLATALMSGTANAGSDKLIMAPAPVWVKAVAVPAKPAKAGEAPLRVLLADQQTRFEAGRISTYVNVAMELQTPQGLAAGNLSLPWNPETDDLTVHKLVIHRDGKLIDVLTEGQTFTVVRREPNLESAMLDGVLTANIQPEGLQVGDILEYAMTITRNDPVLKGHVEQVGAAWNGVPFVRAHMSVEWPSSLPVTFRQNGALPAIKSVKSGDMTRAELSLDNVEPVIPPRLAPVRYSMGRLLEFSDFKSWADLGTLLAPLYGTAAVIPATGPLRNELEKIKASTADPVKRTEAALALVQDRIRYVALLMGSGGLTPAKAEETWARRYGDCKAKTALLLALLHELGVEADPVAVNAFLGDAIDQRLPMVSVFNHVLVRAKVAGRVYWLDGTRSGDTSLARLQTPNFGWGLPLVAKNAALVRMVPEPLAEPDYDLAIDMDVRAGLSLPAKVKAQVVLRGDDAIGTRLALANLDAAARDNSLREYWKERLDDIEISKVAASFDPATGVELLTMEGTAAMDWEDDQYWTDGTWVGYEADFSRTGGADPDAPFAVEFPTYSRTVQTIQLPPGFTEQNIFRKEPIGETVAGIEYRRQSSLAGNVFRIERIVRAIAPEFEAKDAPAAQKRLRELNDLPVSIRKPSGYQRTQLETDKLLTEAPKTGEAYKAQGWAFFGRGQYAEAWHAFNEALKIDPGDWAAMFGRITTAEADPKKGVLVAAKELEPLAPQQEDNPVVSYVRGQAKAQQGAYADALVYLDKAIAKLPAPNENFLLTRAGIKLALGKPEDALGDANKAAEISPESAIVLYTRANIYRQTKRYDAALADTATLLRLNPNEVEAHLVRANIFRTQGKRAEALAEAEALITANPEDGYAHVVASRILDAMGAKDRALAAIGRAITLKPDATAYLNRSALRPKADFADRLADIDTAIKLDPDMDDAYSMRAALLIDRGDMAEALKSYTILVDKYPSNVTLRTNRGIAYARQGDAARAETDFAQARQYAIDASSLNAICFDKATAGIALDRALEECTAALAKEPDSAPILDSKGLVLLRLGRFDEAITLFDKALAGNGQLAESLYGRAIAWQRLGNENKAQGDKTAALKIDPAVQKRFEGYGVMFDSAASPKS